MWGSNRPDATRAKISQAGLTKTACQSGALPRLERAHFPAFFLLAGCSLHPGLRAAVDITRQKIPASLAVLGIGGGDRGDGAARARMRIFPRGARVFAAAVEYVGSGRPRIDQVAGG